MIRWLKGLLGERRPPRNGRDDLERVTKVAEKADDRSKRASAEAEQLAETLRKTVAAMRAEHKHW